MDWRGRMRALALPLLGRLLFGLALAALHRELAATSTAELAARLRAIPASRVALAIGFTTLSYTALAFYDVLSARILALPLTPLRAALAGFLGCVASHNLGALFGGTAMRFRVYASYGIGAVDVARVLALDAVTFWLGFLAVGAGTLAFAATALPPAFVAAAPSGPVLATILLVPIAAYAFARRLCGGAPLRIGEHELPLAPTPAAAAQIALGAFDWLVAAGALFVLLPPDAALPFPALLAAFLLSAVIGAASHVPGGIGVFEGTMVSLLARRRLVARLRRARRGHRLAEPFSAGWIVAIVLVVQASVWLVLLAYRHVEYDHELWWQFELDAHAPRSMRAGVAVLLVLLVVSLRRLLRAAPPEALPPGEAELARALPIVACAPEASAHLALVGDKSLLFHESGEGFVMYAASGRCFVAMGDPVGPPALARDLVWTFRERAEEHGHQAVFYEVRSANLPLYLDVGLTLTKLGEQARVPLADFSLDGSQRKALRYAKRRVEREGGQFDVLPPEAVPPLLDELEAVSRGWLAAKGTREKGFSLGFFDRAYLARLPLGVVRREGRVLAFANLWPSGGGEELSIDMMRHTADAPPGVMEYLFAALMLWGRAWGSRHFDLGMAPLSGLESRALAPLWSRLGARVFRHGERFYNFRGLRAYKEKFDPVWEPRYLASPGGLALPSVLVSVASLISRGLVGTVRR